MLQFLKINNDKLSESEFEAISGNDIFTLFTKKFIFLLIYLYSIIFVIAIDPFTNIFMEPMGFEWKYYLTGLIMGILFLILIYIFFKYFSTSVAYNVLAAVLIVSSLFMLIKGGFSVSFLIFFYLGILSGIALLGLFHYLLVKLVSDIFYFFKFKDVVIKTAMETVSFTNKDGELKIPAEEIESLRLNIFENLVIETSSSTHTIPSSMLSDENRAKFLSMFDDNSPHKTILLAKLKDLMDALCIAFIIAMHIREYIIQAYFIPTGSMEDTLLVGDHLLVEKLTYGPVIPKMIGFDKEVHLNVIGIRDIERGDIVIFKPPNEIQKDYIKRCIALPGDEVNIINGSVYLNKKRLDETYTKGITTYDDFRGKKIEGVVPEGMVVVLGDNRENSFDSRGFGYLPIERIKGRAFVLYWNTKQLFSVDFSRLGLIR